MKNNVIKKRNKEKKYLLKKKNDTKEIKRERKKAEKIAKNFGGEAIEINQIPSSLKEFDCFISSTAATEILLTKDDLSQHINKPLLIIDIAIPRDIDPEVSEIEFSSSAVS